MTQVIDASALVLGHTDDGPRGQWALALVNEGGLTGPSLARAEAGNALRRMEYHGVISSHDAESALREILGLHIDLREFEPYVQRVWELRHNVTTYDAWYIAMAEDFGCRLVTGDRRLTTVPNLRCEIVTPPRA